MIIYSTNFSRLFGWSKIDVDLENKASAEI